MKNIGAKVFVSRKNWQGVERAGAKVRLAKITGYENVSGEIQILIKIQGEKQETSSKLYNLFDTIEEAVESIKS